MDASVSRLQPFLAEHLGDVCRDTDNIHSEPCDDGWEQRIEKVLVVACC